MPETLNPGYLPLKMTRGSRFGPITITCKDGNGTVFPLTGFTVRSIARPEFPSPNQFDLEAAISATPADGKIEIELTGDETLKNFPAGNYQYDVVLVTSGGVRGTPSVAGPLLVVDESSRPA